MNRITVTRRSRNLRLEAVQGGEVVQTASGSAKQVLAAFREWSSPYGYFGYPPARRGVNGGWAPRLYVGDQEVAFFHDDIMELGQLVAEGGDAILVAVAA